MGVSDQRKSGGRGEESVWMIFGETSQHNTSPRRSPGLRHIHACYTEADREERATVL